MLDEGVIKAAELELGPSYKHIQFLLSLLLSSFEFREIVMSSSFP